MNKIKPILKVENLQKDYEVSSQEKLTVLRDISFTASRGEVIVLMGPSGSGKSTLLNLIGGLEQPTLGQVAINDKYLSELNDDDRTELRRDKMGILFQFFELHRGFTSQETLELKLIISQITHHEQYDSIIDLLTQVGMKDKVNQIVDELSRGEQQRVALARALVNNPKLILADEPTGALDLETASEIMQLLRSKANALNSLLIISTHDYNIPQNGDRILQLEDGRIIKDIPSISRAKYLKMNGLEDLVFEISKS